jgi:hypothetical protein
MAGCGRVCSLGTLHSKQRLVIDQIPGIYPPKPSVLAEHGLPSGPLSTQPAVQHSPAALDFLVKAAAESITAKDMTKLFLISHVLSLELGS